MNDKSQGGGLTVGYGRFDGFDRRESFVPVVDLVMNGGAFAVGGSIRSTADPYSKYKKFMGIARAFAQMSKDPSTKVGCVILGTGTYEVKASGWNGAVRGCNADEDHRFTDRSTKLLWAAHAEANAISNAARTGTPLQGSTMVVTHIPCSSCAKLIVQAGITAVVCPKPDGVFAERWAEDIYVTRAMFAECSVHLHDYTEAA